MFSVYSNVSIYLSRSSFLIQRDELRLLFDVCYLIAILIQRFAINFLQMQYLCEKFV